MPFDTYKHKLSQPFWCEYCNKKGHLSEYCRLALRDLPHYTPNQNKPTPTPKSSKGKGKTKVERTTVKSKDNSGKKKKVSGINKKAPKTIQIWVPKGTFAPN